MIQLNHVTKEYKIDGTDKGTMALDDVSLHIERRDFVAIIGTSGSGKSTLLHILGAMDTMTSGEYFYDKEAVHKMKNMKLHKFRKEHISFVFQNFALMAHYTIYENVELPLRAKNIPKKQRKKIVMDQLEKVGLSKVAKKFPRHLSGGQQQRCAIARALASGNELILADEPTGALDSQNSKEILSILKELNRMGKTVILVTHDINIAKEAKCIIQMEDGKIATIKNKARY